MTCTFHLVEDLKNARSELITACQDVSDADLRRRPPTSQAEPFGLSLRTKPTEAGWAIIELLAHLPDVDRYYLAQARALRDLPGHTFVYFDEEAWQREHPDAIERDVHTVKLAMAAAHDEVVHWTRALTPEELDREGGHPRRASISVREMIQRIANHDRTHTEQVTEIRRALAAR